MKPIFRHTHTIVIETLCSRVEIPVEAWPVDENVVFFYTSKNVAGNDQAEFYTMSGVLYRYDDIEVTDYPVDAPWKICRRGFESSCMPIKPNMEMAHA